MELKKETNLTSPENLADEVRNLLSLALERPIHAGEWVSRETEPTWDSLKHIELVFLLEDTFDIRFAPDEIPTIDSLESIIERIASHRAA